MKVFTRLQLYYTSQGLGFVYFWISIAIPYLMHRGLSSVEAFSLMSLYQLFGVLLEYPTGVIGDKYGYRKVLFFANSFNALSMIILAQSGSYWLYLFGLLVLALGTSLSSGNDLGLLKTVSANLRRDTAHRTAMAEFIIFLSAIIGAWLGAISFELALYLSATVMFSANIPLFFLKDDGSHKVDEHSLNEIVKDGIVALKNPILAQIFLILAVYGGLFYSVKSIFGSFADLYNFDLKFIGLIVGLGALTRSIGSAIIFTRQYSTKSISFSN